MLLLPVTEARPFAPKDRRSASAGRTVFVLPLECRPQQREPTSRDVSLFIIFQDGHDLIELLARAAPGFEHQCLAIYLRYLFIVLCIIRVCSKLRQASYEA